MRVLAIGDIHGRSEWAELVEQEKFDHVVFIGDYLDTHEDIDGISQLENFLQIMEYKKENPETVTCLVGNHDLHYLIDQHYSGFQDHMAVIFNENLLSYFSLLEAAAEFDGVLYTHAGLTARWQEAWLGFTVESLNSLLKKNPNAFGFLMEDTLAPAWRMPSPVGDNIWQGPMWVRPGSLMRDPGTLTPVDDAKADPYTPKQVVGHTRQGAIEIKGDFAFIDNFPDEYLIVEDGNFEVKET